MDKEPIPSHGNSSIYDSYILTFFLIAVVVIVVLALIIPPQDVVVSNIAEGLRR